MRRLIVHVPELEFLPGGAAALPRRLARMLGRGRRVAGDPGRLLGAALGVGELPAPAVLTRLASGDPPSGTVWLRFDPIGMVPDLTAVWLEQPLTVDFGAERMRPVTAELEAMFAAEGLAWDPEPGAGHGLLELESVPETRFLPLAEAPGRRLDEALPQGREADRWRRLINESQMVFHQFRSVAASDQRGAGLWFWGPGRLPPKPAPTSLSVFDRTGDAIVAGLARWLGVAVDSGREGLSRAVADDNVLLHWTLRGGHHGDDGGGDPVDALCELADRWLAPASARLLAPAITILGSTGGWHIPAREPLMSQLMFWRRPQAAGFAEDAG